MGTIDTLLRVKADASNAVRGLAPLQASLQKTAAEAEKTETALNGLDGQHRISVNDDAIAGARKEVERLRTMMREQLTIDPQADTRSAERQIKRLQAQIRVLDQQQPEVEVVVETDTTSLDDLKGQLAGLAAGGAGLAGAWKLTGLAADVETTQIALSSLTGSVEAGAQAFADLQKFAATTPFELGEVTAAARALLAAGVDPGNLPKMLTDLGNAASAVGAPMQEVAVVFQQMLTKGKVSNEEMLQLAERGVPAYQALADVLGVTVAQVQEMASKGELGTEEINKLSQALGDMFPTSMSDQAESLNGQLSTLGDNVTQIGGQIGAVFLPTVKDLVGSLNGLLGTISSVVGSFQDLPGPVKDAVGHFLVLTGIVSSAAFFGPKILAALVTARTLITGTGDAALIASGKLKLFGGVLLATAGLTGLGALSGKLQKAFDTHLNTDNLTNELLILANTGEVVGGMADSLHTDLSGLRGDFVNLQDPVQEVGDLIAGWIPGVTTPLEDSAANISEIDKALSGLVDSGNFDDANKLFQLFVDKAAAAGMSVDEAKDMFPGYETALKEAAAAAEAGVDPLERYNDRLLELSDAAEAADTKFQRLKESFNALNDDMITSQSLISDAQAGIDALAESLVKDMTFNLDLEAGRTNFDNLKALAETRSAQITKTFEDGGRNAAVAQSKAFRHSMAQMLIDAGHTPKRAWQLVNQVMSKPIEINIELAKIDKAKLNRRKDKLLARKEEILYPVNIATNPRAADEAAIDIAKDLKPIDAKIQTVNVGIDEANEVLGETANPKGKKGKDDRTARIGTKVDTTTADEALTTFINTKRPAIHVPVELDIKVPVVTVSGVDIPITVTERSITPETPAAAPVGPAGLRTASATMMSEPYFGPRAAAGRIATAPTTTQPGQVTRLAPKQTPIAVYLDGMEIASRIESRRAMSAVESVRRAP